MLCLAFTKSPIHIFPIYHFSHLLLWVSITLALSVRTSENVNFLTVLSFGTPTCISCDMGSQLTQSNMNAMMSDICVVIVPPCWCHLGGTSFYKLVRVNELYASSGIQLHNHNCSYWCFKCKPLTNRLIVIKGDCNKDPNCLY